MNASGWMEIQNIATLKLVQAGGASVIGAAITVEVGRMVIAALWEERNRRRALAQGREEGRGEGRGEMQKLWLEWNRRRLDAEREGRPFAEPPPQVNNHH